MINDTILVDLPRISMENSIFELSIDESNVVNPDCSTPSMWLVIFIDHAVIVYSIIQSTYFDIVEWFKYAFAFIEWWCLKFSIPIFYVYFSFFIKCLWCVIWYIWILIENILDLWLVNFFLGYSILFFELIYKSIIHIQFFL